MASTDLKVEPVTADQEGISNLIMSGNVYPLTEAQKPTDPYAFGGLKVVPRGNRTFGPEDEIWYLLELRNPALNEEAAPSIRMKLEVTGEKADGKPVKMAAPMADVQPQPVKDTPGHYMIGQSFPAGAFAPGKYTLKATVFDATAKKTFTAEKSFTVTK